MSSTLCRIVCLIPGAGLRFPFLSSQASWQRLGIPLPLLLGLRALLYRPYQTREIIAMGDCYVLCGRSGVTSTALLHIVRVVSGCLSPQGVARRKTTVSFWLRKTISRAYELSCTEQPVPAPRASETRGIALSFLFKKNFAVDQVLKSGMGEGMPPLRVTT